MKSSLWQRFRRVSLVFLVVLFVVGPYFPFLGSTIVNASTTSLLEPRSIQMSDSGASNNATIVSGIGSGTSVTYKVSFYNPDSFNSLVINFCDNSPIIGDTCLDTTTFPGETSPGNMSVSGATITPISTTCGSGNEVGGTGWSSSTPNAYTVELTSGGSNTICGAGTQVFSISGITNPDVIESFYARIYTYAADSPSTDGYTGPVGSAVGTYTDYGGIAMSTTQVITITARVEEILEFCVSGDAQNSTVNPSAGDPWSPGDCSSTQASISPAITLGTDVGSEIVLTPEQVWTGEDYFQLSTNATNGATIYMHSSNSCGGLSADGGSHCPIEAAGDYSGNSGETSAYDFNTAATDDVALFGVRLGDSSDGTDGSANGVGSLTDVSTYNDGNSTDYGLDDSATTGVTGTYGNEIASTTSSCYLLNDSIVFAATSSLSTPAGIYSTNISLIATGNF